MGAESALRCMGTKAPQRKIFPTLHPRTIVTRGTSPRFWYATPPPSPPPLPSGPT